MLSAEWSDTSGHTARFRLVGSESEEHPFKCYTKRRGNRAGSRFRACLVDVDSGDVIYDDEVMLADWKEDASGRQVKFWMQVEEGIHPLDGYQRRSRDKTGSRFMAALRELDDDESEVDEAQRERAERHSKPQHLSQVAALMCQNPMFLEFLGERVELKAGYTWNAETAASYIRWKCGIESRADLDSDSRAARVFHQDIREPFVDWQEV